MHLSQLVHDYTINCIYLKRGDEVMKVDLATWNAHTISGGLFKGRIVHKQSEYPL